MAVGKGSIARATRALKDDNKDKAVFTEPKTVEKVEEKAAEKNPVKKTTTAKKSTSTAKKSTSTAKKTTTSTTKKTTASKSTATKTATKKVAKPAKTKEEPQVVPVVEEKKDTKKTYEHISRIKSDLPYHLL